MNLRLPAPFNGTVCLSVAPDGGCSWRGNLEPALLRRLVKAQALKHGSAHFDRSALPLMRPFGELDLGHQFGLHEMHWTGTLDFAEEGTAAELQLVQAAPHVGMRLLGEAAACMPDMDEAVLVIV